MTLFFLKSIITNLEKTKYRLRNVTITDNIANISYGKRIDRITVNLEDSNYIITDQDSEKNGNIEHQLNDELNSLQIYNHNLEKKINKFRRKSNTSKSSSTIVSSSDSEDEDNTSLQKNNDHINILVNDLHKWGYTIESNPDDVWESLINVVMKNLEEGRDMVVENFEKKIIASKESQESEKKKKYSNFGKSLNSLALKVMTSESIQITDEESAKERITQWVDQKNHSKQVELATKAYKLYHRMSLVYIYNDLHIISVEKHPNDEREQEDLNETLCAPN
ncbi:unnamed protein product [Rhizophagus irregularis]|nr:unnamed protein product [Rhizophagus irregularis]